ncbi:type IV secretion system protein [Burkholderia multivorans]|uniref:type IV secretion system protein n=1 Tax=Burkholderia multivorans TaxID=87883 RepID=UPI000D007FE0|nr:type IV secretion system protein [Burkholderia multivorans]MBU9122935.1 type IV secretion system protein [Burkholderia multivorans]MDN7867561.1 type IV secretion system protein [Burkholderia multivorans]MDR8920783.1 Type IV secretion system protein VirB6 [Burkholderia multivorans]MDR8926864.1 Type IV secretion system protein VirB6 [Burkholderia multivorans]MDR8969231.1 Type IV secretion system protein VirB6 [Burkholderia multivorans]
MAGPYEQVLTYVTNVCDSYIGSSVAAVASAIAPAAYTLLGVYIILWGLASMRGLIQEPIMEAAIRMMKIAFIFGIGIKLAEYNVYVVDTFFNSPEQLAQSLTNATSNQATVNSLDQILSQGFQIGKGFWDKGGILDGDFGMYLVAVFVWAITIIVTAYACFLIVLAKIALSLIIALGPLFIISLLFQPTANFFNSWIQQLANYALLVILVVSANVFILTLFVRAASATAGISSTAQIDQIFPFIITGVISLLVLAQLPSISAGLAGGISLSSYGMGRFALGKIRGLFDRNRGGNRSGGNRNRDERREPRPGFNYVRRT